MKTRRHKKGKTRFGGSSKLSDIEDMEKEILNVFNILHKERDMYPFTSNECSNALRKKYSKVSFNMSVITQEYKRIENVLDRLKNSRYNLIDLYPEEDIQTSGGGRSYRRSYGRSKANSRYGHSRASPEYGRGSASYPSSHNTTRRNPTQHLEINPQVPKTISLMIGKEIKEVFNRIEEKVRNIYKMKNVNTVTFVFKDEEKHFLKNIQNCFFIIDHYVVKIKEMIIKEGDDITIGNKWQSMSAANKDYLNKEVDLTYLWINNVTKYFEKQSHKCPILNKTTTKNVLKVLSSVSDNLLNQIIDDCDETTSEVIEKIDSSFVDRLNDQNVQKYFVPFFKKTGDSVNDKSILCRLLTLASQEDLHKIVGDKDCIKKITLIHSPVEKKGGGIINNITKSVVGKKKEVFSNRTAYDNIFEKADSGSLQRLVELLIESEKIGDVITILGVPNFNNNAIGKIKAIVKANPDLKPQLNVALSQNDAARNFYTSANDNLIKTPEKEESLEDSKRKGKKSNQVIDQTYDKKVLSAVETAFRDKIKNFVESGDNNNNPEEQMKFIHAMYDELAEHNEIKGNRKLLKNVVNNLIDYTTSVYFGRHIENNMDEEKWPDALVRRDLVIDQFTRLNTKPNVDPILERIITTFWPEANAINYKRPPAEIISKETLIETRLYPTLPNVMLKVDKKDTGTNDTTKDNTSYGSKIMTLTEKVNGDQSDYDALGVEMFINTLLTTGSNVAFVPEIAFSESYKIEENLDNSAYVTKEM